MHQYKQQQRSLLEQQLLALFSSGIRIGVTMASKAELGLPAGGQAWYMVERSLLFHLEGWYISNRFEAISSLFFHCFVGQLEILVGSRTLFSQRHVFCPGFISMMPDKFFL